MMTAPLSPRFPGDAQPCPGMTPSRSPPLIPLTLGGIQAPNSWGDPEWRTPGRLRHGGIGGRAGARRRQPVLRMAMLRSPPPPPPRGRGSPGHRWRPPAGVQRAMFPWDGWQLLEALGTAGERLPPAAAVLERGGPAVTFAPGWPGPATAPPLQPPSMPSPKMLRQKGIAALTPPSRWREMEPFCPSRAGSSRGRSFHDAGTPGSARLDLPGSARRGPPSQPRAQITWELFYLVEFMGLFGDGHHSQSLCSCRGMMVRGSAWWDPHGTPREGGLPWDTRGGRWLGGVPVPVMAPAVTAAVAGRDRGVFPLRGPRKQHFELGWTQQVGNPKPKNRQKRRKHCSRPSTPPSLPSSRGKALFQGRGHPGGWMCPDGKRVSCESGCPNPASSFRSPFPILVAVRAEEPRGDGDRGSLCPHPPQTHSLTLASTFLPPELSDGAGGDELGISWRDTIQTSRVAMVTVML